MIGFIRPFDTARDYILQFTITHTLYSVHSHVFTSRCSVAASNGGRSPSSGFLNYPRPKLSASHSISSRLNASSPLIHSLTHQPTIVHFSNSLHCLTVLLTASRHGRCLAKSLHATVCKLFHTEFLGIPPPTYFLMFICCRLC
jgi:hypothetical protein